MQNIPIVTIDGPGGSGKGTISKMLCMYLGWNILDSGALYRTLAFMLNEKGISLKDFPSKKEEIRGEFRVSFDPGEEGEPVKVILKNKDITHLVRTERIASETSKISASAEIRSFIRPCQRDYKKFPGLVADGRDMGTVIFPEADLKIYLTASLEERAKRREIQLKRLGTKVNMRTLLDELEARDKKDIERDLSPLRPAEDSFVIDTTGLSPEEVLEKIRDLFTDL